MVAVIVVCVVVTLLVLALSILTINKGYAYKQSVDPLPSDEEKERNDNH